MTASAYHQEWPTWIPGYAGAARPPVNPPPTIRAPSIEPTLAARDLDVHRPTPRIKHGAGLADFSAWYVNQIWAKPNPMDFGNIISAQSRTLIMLSTYRYDRQVLQIDEAALAELGISVDTVFPVSFDPFEQHEFQFTAAVLGPGSFDEQILFDFGGFDMLIEFVGARLLLFPFAPDWSNGIREKLSWVTDRLESELGVAQRRAMRLSPRRQFSAEFILENAERTQWDLTMLGWRANDWALPLWHEIQLLAADVAAGAIFIPCVTADRDFEVGGLAVLRSEVLNVAEVVEIAEIDVGGIDLAGPTTLTWSKGTRLYPARVARLASRPESTRLTDRAARAKTEWIIEGASDWPELVLPTYRGFGIYADHPDESDDLTQTAEWLAKALDNLSGLTFIADKAAIGIPTQLHRWVLDGLSEHAAWRSLLYTLRGAQVPVWIPTHSDDLHLVLTFPGGTTTMTIGYVGYARFGLGQPARRNIRIELKNGTLYHGRIIDATDLEDGREQLVLEDAFPDTIEPQDVRSIMFMTLCTGEDEIEVNHVTDAQGVSIASMLFTAERDDELP